MPTKHARLEVYIDGVFTQVTSVSITRGMDSEYATADVDCIYPLPSGVAKFSKIVVMASGGTLFCERFVGWVLSFGETHFPGHEVLHCGDEMALLKDFYPLNDISFDGMTDQQIITRVLVEAGIPSSHYDIQGTGKKIGGVKATKGLHWPFIQSALEVIKEIDSFSLGYRTYCEQSGMILRRLVQEFPGTTPGHIMRGGYEILSGSATFEEVDPKTQVNVLGDGASTKLLDPDDSQTWRSNPWWKKYKQLQIQAEDVDFHSTDEVAAWIFSRLNRTFIRATISTYLDDQFGMLETIRTDFVPQMRTEGIDFWLQSQTLTLDSSGKFNQSLNLVTEWHFPIAVPPGSSPPMVGGPGTGIPIVGLTPTTLAPSAADILANFSVTVSDAEIIVIAGVKTILYTVVVSDLSTTLQSYLTTRVWAASGTGVRAPSGVGRTFTTGFTDLTGATITLTVTNNLGYSKSITRDITAIHGGVGTRVRKLYATTDDDFWAFGADLTWRSYGPASPPPVALGPGPVASGGLFALITADDLATPATEVQVFTSPDSDISDIWEEPDISQTRIAAGSVDGRIALSIDTGATWTILDGPDGTAIRRIIISRYNISQVHCVTELGYYVSYSGGTGWLPFRLGDFTDLILSHTRNVLLTADGDLINAVTGTVFTFSSGSHVLVCAAPDIQEDRFYAIEDDGTAWFTATDGGTVLATSSSIPSGTPQAKGMWRDGSMHNVVYFAAGDGGLWKTTDGFKTTIGYVQLHEA